MFSIVALKTLDISQGSVGVVGSLVINNLVTHFLLILTVK